MSIVRIDKIADNQIDNQIDKKIEFVVSTQTTWDIGITTTSANQTFGIQLNGTSPNI